MLLQKHITSEASLNTTKMADSIYQALLVSRMRRSLYVSHITDWTQHLYPNLLTVINNPKVLQVESRSKKLRR